MGIFDDLIQKIDEPDRAVLQKYPVLREEVEKLDSLLSRWEDWRTKEYDDASGLTRTAIQTIRQKDDEIEALRLLQGTNEMNWDDIETNIKKSGYVKKSDLATELAPQLTASQKAEEDRRNILARGMEITYAKTAAMPLQYFQEFGEVRPTIIEDVFKHMTDKGINDFTIAYDQLVAEKRAAKATEVAAAREQKIRDDTRAEVLREQAMRQDAMPVDSRGSAPESMGFLQRKKQGAKDDEAPKLTPGTLGDMTGANDAYRKYLADQANGTKPVVQ